MPLPSDLIVDLPPDELEHSFETWNWLIGPGAKPLHVTAAGDVIFLQNDQVFLLDTGAGAIEKIAGSIGAFETGLNDPENVSDWFMARVVNALRTAGSKLRTGQCYGYTTLPVFAEGSYDASNRFALSALEHIEFTADIHKQIRDLPDGARVKIDVA